MKSILLLSGPNLSLTGQREPAIYGDDPLAELVERARRVAAAEGFELEHVCSETEGELVRAVHSARGTHDAIIVNPGALTHYGWSLADALATFGGPIVEVHLSQPASRESWRHISVVSPVARATLSGLGSHGYELAVLAVARMA